MGFASAQPVLRGRDTGHGIMRKIQLKDAKANLSAVVIGLTDWQRLSSVPSFGRLLISSPLEPGDLPRRNRAPMRGPMTRD